jgi:hypothetical protein
MSEGVARADLDDGAETVFVLFNDEWIEATWERSVVSGIWVRFGDGTKTLVPFDEVAARIRSRGKRKEQDANGGSRKRGRRQEQVAGEGGESTKNSAKGEGKREQDVRTDKKAGGGAKTKKERPSDGRRGGGVPWAAREPRLAEVKHLVHFLLAQLRWQHGRLVGSFAEFDAEAARHNSVVGDEDTVDDGDVEAMAPLMNEFFSRHARGDRWVPFFPVLGEHELYLMRRIWALRGLDTKQKYALSCGFSGSRWPPLFEEAILCSFSANDRNAVAKEDESHELSTEARLLFKDPHAAFRRGGAIHKRFLAYRERGGKLHTTCFSPRPVPPGASGKEYTFYILERTKTFFVMGLDLFGRLDALKESGGWEAIDRALQETKWVGPTVSKMFLVSTHFGLPALHLLDEGIEVGIGAQESFKILHPGIQPAKNFDMLPDRREILVSIFKHVRSLLGDATSSATSPAASFSSSSSSSSSSSTTTTSTTVASSSLPASGL